MESFDGKLIINLGSRYAGWMEDICFLLAESRELIRTSSLSISKTKLSGRMKELKYICLVGSLAITETRRIFKPIRMKEDQKSIEALGKVLDKMQNPSNDDRNNKPQKRDDESEPRDPHENEEEDLGNEPPDKDSDMLEEGDFPSDRNDTKSEKLLPHHGVSEDGGAVIVDCYGIYVQSLRDWLRCMLSNNPSYNSATVEVMGRLAQRLDKNNDDGPAVLLCPELIETAYRTVMNSAPLPIRKNLSLHRKSHLLLLKLTFLHEIGHHIFPVFASGFTRYFSEGMANWFVYCLIDPIERAALYEKSKMQTLPYQMYQGMLPLFYPFYIDIDDIELEILKKPEMSLAGLVEGIAFRAQTTKCRGILLNPYHHRFLDHYLRGCHHLRRLLYHRYSYPVQVMMSMACTLLVEALDFTSPGCNEAREVERAAEYIEHCFPLRPIPEREQRRWLEKIWRSGIPPYLM